MGCPMGLMGLHGTPYGTSHVTDAIPWDIPWSALSHGVSHGYAHGSMYLIGYPTEYTMDMPWIPWNKLWHPWDIPWGIVYYVVPYPTTCSVDPMGYLMAFPPSHPMDYLMVSHGLPHGRCRGAPISHGISHRRIPMGLPDGLPHGLSHGASIFDGLSHGMFHIPLDQRPTGQSMAYPTAIPFAGFTPWDFPWDVPWAFPLACNRPLDNPWVQWISPWLRPRDSLWATVLRRYLVRRSTTRTVPFICPAPYTPHTITITGRPSCSRPPAAPAEGRLY